MVAAKTLAPTMNPASPSRTACAMRNGVAASAATSSTPWLMLFAISSPRDCSRSGTASDMLTTSHPTRPIGPTRSHYSLGLAACSTRGQGWRMVFADKALADEPNQSAGSLQEAAAHSTTPYHAVG